jgi:mono/diheme cytochrome c family protein
MAAHGDDYLRECIINGRPKSGMPAWGKSGAVKRDDIAHLIAYIRGFSADSGKK